MACDPEPDNRIEMEMALSELSEALLDLREALQEAATAVQLLHQDIEDTNV